MGGAHKRSFKPLDLKLQRARQAQALHDSGMGYARIAIELGTSIMSAWRWHQFAIDWDNRGYEPNGQRSRKSPRYRNTRGQPPVTRRRLKGGHATASGHWRPREPGWASVYCSWCPKCRQRYTRGRPCCPTCGYRDNA